jgi:hypothetical protein
MVGAAQPAQSQVWQDLYIIKNGCVFTTLYPVPNQLMCVPAVPCVHSFLIQAHPEESSLLVYRPPPSQRPYDVLLCSHLDGLLGPAVFAGTEVAASSLLVIC